MPRRLSRRRLLIGFAVGLAWAGSVGFVAACGTSEDDALPAGFDAVHSDLTPAEARAFADFSLYWAGASFEGSPLTAITLPRGFVTFIYGDCKAASDSGCSPPLQVQVWRACERNLSSYALTPAGDPLPHQRVRLRGVPAAFFEGGARLELYTGDVSVVLFGEGRNQLRRAAEALRGANVGVGRAADLPPPVEGALAGRLRC